MKVVVWMASKMSEFSRSISVQWASTYPAMVMCVVMTVKKGKCLESYASDCSTSSVYSSFQFGYKQIGRTHICFRKKKKTTWERGLWNVKKKKWHRRQDIAGWRSQPSRVVPQLGIMIDAIERRKVCFQSSSGCPWATNMTSEQKDQFKVNIRADDTGSLLW